MLPDFTNNWDMAVAVFIMPIAVQWWAVWYPGAEPGGGSYIAQRMLASKSEKDALGAVLFFNVAHYVLRPWPWILVALCSILVYPELSDIQRAFPNLDPSLLGHDIAYPAMLKFLPAGFVGLMVGGLIAANSSTILTHLNWGASYLVHDFYRRFIRRDAERAALRAWPAGSSPSACSSARPRSCLSPRHGEGHLRHHPADRRGHRPALSRALVLVARERVVRGRRDDQLVRRIGRCCWCWQETASRMSTHAALLITIGVTTVCWVATAWLGPETDRAVLIEFYRKVRPVGAGLGAHSQGRRAAGRRDGSADNIPLAMLGWTAGCTAIWSALFTVGNLLYMRPTAAAILFVVFLVSTLVAGERHAEGVGERRL